MIKREDKSDYIIEIRDIDNITEMIEANINFDYNKMLMVTIRIVTFVINFSYVLNVPKNA